jgi:hypothetical protein
VEVDWDCPRDECRAARSRRPSADRRIRETVWRILDAFARERRCEMSYAKPGASTPANCVLAPHRMVYAQGTTPTARRRLWVNLSPLCADAGRIWPFRYVPGSF